MGTIKESETRHLGQFYKKYICVYLKIGLSICLLLESVVAIQSVKKNPVDIGSEY